MRGFEIKVHDPVCNCSRFPSCCQGSGPPSCPRADRFRPRHSGRVQPHVGDAVGHRLFAAAPPTRLSRSLTHRQENPCGASRERSQRRLGMRLSSISSTCPVGSLWSSTTARRFRCPQSYRWRASSAPLCTFLGARRSCRTCNEVAIRTQRPGRVDPCRLPWSRTQRRRTKLPSGAECSKRRRRYQLLRWFQVAEVSVEEQIVSDLKRPADHEGR